MTMLSKRSLLKGISAFGAWFGLVKPSVAVLSIAELPKLPKMWPQDGWVPQLGQIVTADEFPDLFLPREGIKKRGKFIPIGFGQISLKLPHSVSNNNQTVEIPSRLPYKLNKPTGGWASFDNKPYGFIGKVKVFPLPMVETIETIIVSNARILTTLISVKHQKRPNGQVLPAGSLIQILVELDELECYCKSHGLELRLPNQDARTIWCPDYEKVDWSKDSLFAASQG